MQNRDTFNPDHTPFTAEQKHIAKQAIEKAIVEGYNAPIAVRLAFKKAGLPSPTDQQMAHDFFQILRSIKFN